MQNSIWRTLLAVIAGFVGGSIAMMACHMATQGLYPPPEGLDMMDPDQRDAVAAWMKTLPDSAYVVVVLCHWVGAAVGAAIAMLITRRLALRPALITGTLFLVAGIINVASLPHPTWFPFVDLPGYLLVAWLVGRLLLRGPASAPEAAPTS